MLSLIDFSVQDKNARNNFTLDKDLDLDLIAFAIVGSSANTYE